MIPRLSLRLRPSRPLPTPRALPLARVRLHAVPRTLSRPLSRALSSTRRPSTSSQSVRPAEIAPPLNNLSSVVGPTDPPLDERTLGAFWSSTVASYPTSPALVSRWERSDAHLASCSPGGLAGGECVRWSYAKMDEYVDALARGLLGMGLKKGDRVGVFLGNGSAYAMLQWATAKVRFSCRWLASATER